MHVVHAARVRVFVCERGDAPVLILYNVVRAGSVILDSDKHGTKVSPLLHRNSN